VSSYQTIGSRHLKKPQSLTVSRIGKALPAIAVEVTRDTLEELGKLPEVLAVMPNQRIRHLQPKEVSYAQLNQQEQQRGITWGMERLEIPQIWETTKGSGVKVAVLDTGVYGDHSALEGRVKKFVVIDPLGRRIETARTFDSGQHGTHVCGTIAGGKSADGTSIGVAPEADLLAAGVLIGNATLQTLVEGLAWAIEYGADIINMSLGFSYYEPLFPEIFNLLLKQFGILPVVAVGNENYGNSSSPGNAYNALSIGAVENLGDQTHDVAFFSSGASLVFPGQAEELVVTKPDVVGPGVQVYSCIPPEKRSDGVYEYTYMDGTSMATPHVAGVAALLMSAKPDAPTTEIMQVLKETAKHPAGEDERPDNRWGYGLVHPVEALKALGGKF
jgi:subtilisin family serine protease